METLRIETKRLKQVVDLTEKVHTIIQKRHFKEGVCSLFLPHTTAALTTGEVGEGTDEDLLEVAEQMIPKIRFRHAHDPSHAWSHMAASIFGASLHLPVNNGLGDLAVRFACRVGWAERAYDHRNPSLFVVSLARLFQDPQCPLSV